MSAPEASAVARVAAALGSPEVSGAVLTGPAGVGKTLLARAAAAETGGARLHTVTGTAPERVVPFGAFRGLVRPAAIGRPAELLRAARTSLTGASGDLLLIVDDAQHLDSLSATLVYQLALSGSARLIVTVDPHAPLPAVVTALWSDNLLTRIDVEPLDSTRVSAVLESVVGVAPDAATLDEAVARSRGNPLHLRRLVEDGALQHDNRWRWRSEHRLALTGVVDEYLDNLPVSVRSVLSYLAVAEPLSRPDLVALAGAPALADAEAAGAVRCTAEQLVYAAHPLYTERTRAGLSPQRARALRGSVVAELSRQPSEQVSDQLRLAALAVESDRPGAARHRGRNPAGAATRRPAIGRAVGPGRAGPLR